MAVVSFKSVGKRFGSAEVLSEVSFTLEGGRVVGLLGPNGAGKTTTIRILLGLVRPTSGAALINGAVYRDLVQPRRTVGAVLETSGFHPARTGRNHLRIVAATERLAPHRIDAVIAETGLGAVADRKAGTYSMGQRQRLGLAAALLGEPYVLILDEPTNGLDPAGIAWLRETVRRLAATGRTVLISSHLLSEVAQTVDDVVILADGVVRFTGTLDALRRSGAATETLEEAFLRVTRTTAIDHGFGGNA